MIKLTSKRHPIVQNDPQPDFLRNHGMNAAKDGDGNSLIKELKAELK